MRVAYQGSVVPWLYQTIIQYLLSDQPPIITISREQLSGMLGVGKKDWSFKSFDIEAPFIRLPKKFPTDINRYTLPEPELETIKAILKGSPDSFINPFYFSVQLALGKLSLAASNRDDIDELYISRLSEAVDEVNDLPRKSNNNLKKIVQVNRVSHRNKDTYRYLRIGSLTEEESPRYTEYISPVDISVPDPDTESWQEDLVVFLADHILRTYKQIKSSSAVMESVILSEINRHSQDPQYSAYPLSTIKYFYARYGVNGMRFNAAVDPIDKVVEDIYKHAVEDAASIYCPDYERSYLDLQTNEQRNAFMKRLDRLTMGRCINVQVMTWMSEFKSVQKLFTTNLNL